MSVFVHLAAALAFLPGLAAASPTPLKAEYRTDGGDTELVRASHPRKAPFGWHIAGRRFGGVFNAVSYLGYNTSGTGGKAVADEPLMTWNIEQHYMQGERPTLESYWEFRNTRGDRNVRPIFLQFDRETANVNRFTFMGNSFGFQRQPQEGWKDDPEPWLNLYPGAIEITPASGAPAQLQLGTPPEEGSLINMTWGGETAFTIHAVRPNHVKLESGGGATIELVNDQVQVSGPLVMRSPDGTPWALRVDDAGKLTTERAP